MRLSATDATGNTTFTENSIDVTGDLKLGNFQLSFTDIEVPVAGIPISVTRTYDSLYANQQDNFGYGWRLEFRDTNLSTSLRPPNPEEELLGEYPSFQDGTKVYITLPGGKRTTFKFQPKLNPEVEKALRLGAPWPQSALFYVPAFVAEDGSELTLSTDTHSLLRDGDTGEYYSPNGLPYNPAHAFFGNQYTLTTQEGIEYRIDAQSGDLNQVTDLNGNTLTYSDSGILSSTGKEVQFERDAQGRIVAVIDPANNRIEYEYDENGDLIAVIDREGNRTEYFYEEAPRPHYLTRIEDPLGRDGIRTEYGEDGRLSRMLDVNGEAVALEYDLDNSVQTVRDIYGNPTTYVYDNRGNVLTEIDPVGLQTVRTYDERNNVLTETMITAESGPEGWTTTYTYDGQNNQLSETDPLGRTTYYTYGQYGRLLTETDPLGNTTSYDYDSRGNLLSSADSLGNVTNYAYDHRGNLLTLTDANNQVTHFGYDTQGNVTSVTDTQGNITTYTYDANGNRTHEVRKNVRLDETTVVDLTSEWIYDDEGRLLYFIDAEKSNPNRDTTVEPTDFTTKYEYDTNGNQIRVTDAEGRITESIYDEKGQLVATIYPDDTPGNNTDNPRSVMVYDKGGRERASIDANGTITHYQYNEMGELTATFYGDTNWTGFTQNLLEGMDGYNPSGLSLEAMDWTKVLYTLDDPQQDAHVQGLDSTSTSYTQDGRVESETDALGNTTTFIYNNIGQLLETHYPDPDPTDGITDYSVSYTYDDAGRRLTETDGNGNITTYKYDELGRVEQVIFEDDTFTQTEYDELGRRTAFTDPEGIRTEYEYDSLGRLEKVIQWVTQPGETVAQKLETTYKYDELGRLIEAKDAKNQVTKYEYDAAGRRSAVIRPGGERSEMTYYPDGSLKRVTAYFNTGTTNPEAMTYVYDEQGRLQTKELVNDPDVHYVYDINGQVEEIRVGDDPNAVDTEVTRFAYDEQGRLTGRKDPDAPTFTNAAGEFSIFYTYDAAGNVTSVETAAGKTEYTYDAWNRLKTVKQDSDTEATEYVYDPAGNLTQTTFPNGVVETREYDDLNRLETITTTDTQGDGDSSNDVVLAKSEYELNDAGHRMQVTQSLWNEQTQTLESETTNYTYDELYRLLEVQTVGSDGVSYTYDEVGNRAAMQVGDGPETTYVYDANDQLDKVMVGGQVTVDYDYDPDGNLIREAVTGGDTLIYTWDDQNRLVAVAKDGEAPFVTYEYDDDNIRVSQTVEGSTTEFVVDKNRAYAQVLAEYIGSQLIEEYVYGLDLIEQTDGTTGDEAFFGVDGLGSTVVLTDENGDVVQTYEYDEFGELEDAPTELATDYLFTGEQFDESLGDYYLRQRYYDPSIGRFTRRDTYEGRLEEPITLHKYLYANSNPVSYVDPSGLFSLAEVQAARQVRNTLAEAQFASYSELIRNTDSDGVGGQVTGFVDKLLFAIAISQLATALRSVFVNLGTVVREGGAVSDLLFGARPGKGLPGRKGVKIPSRPTPSQLELLSAKHNVEFAVTYKLGSGPNGRGGQYFLHSGGKSSVGFPLEADRMLIYHTHPGGTPSASPADRNVLRILEALGSPQRTSAVVPSGKPVFQFNKNGTIRPTPNALPVREGKPLSPGRFP